MNNKLEVIGIDHGWSMMKTVTQVFVTGVKEITTTPALFGDVLEYDGKYYKIGTVRQEVKDTKVEDDSFYLLTLAAVAKELKKRGLSDAKVFLAVGLPLTRFGAERNNFIKYLTKNKRVDFRYENEACSILNCGIRRMKWICFPMRIWTEMSNQFHEKIMKDCLLICKKRTQPQYFQSR